LNPQISLDQLGRRKKPENRDIPWCQVAIVAEGRHGSEQTCAHRCGSSSESALLQE
jgi:hypothetical protein